MSQISHDCVEFLPSQSSRRCWQIWTLAIAAFIAGFATSQSFGQDDPRPAADEESTLFAETIESGLLFINGEFIKRPYVIEATDAAITVNGMVFQYEYETHPFGGRAGAGFGGMRRGGGYGGNNSRWNRRRSGKRGESFGHEARFSPIVFNARRLHSVLKNDCIVVAFDNQTTLELGSRSAKYEFYQTVLTKDITSAQLSEFINHNCPVSVRKTWENWLQNLTPTPALRTILEARVNEIVQADAKVQQLNSATERLEQFAFPLTIIGMLLGVVAFGHTLKWAGKSLNRGDEQFSDAGRYVVIALLLMFGMSVIDLVWTILAGQAGVMAEMNPVAARFIETPIQLAMFKVFATAIGFGILFIWRQRRQVQQATWWMCLVCILVTFRWVVFDSMLN